MPDYLVATKIALPPSAPNPVVRLRLNQMLSAGLNPGIRLILISAPAGFGKSTQVSTWISSLATKKAAPGEPATPRVAWLSLDSDDNDPARFLAYLNAALEHAQAGLSQSMIHLDAAGAPSIKALFAQLINQITQLGSP